MSWSITLDYEAIRSSLVAIKSKLT